MATSTKTSTTTTRRDNGRTVYMHVVRNWAVSAAEVAEDTGLSRKETNSLLRQLERKGLLASEHVNSERELTWQSYFDIENEQRVPQRAAAAFRKAWPEDAPENGDTGSDTPRPRYTDAQLAKAKAAKAKGGTRKQVAEAAGIRSPNYLAKLLKRMAEEEAKAARAAKRSRKPKAKAAASK